MSSKRTTAMKGGRAAKRLTALGIAICMVFSQGLLVSAKTPKAEGTVINVLDYGADPTGIKDSTVAVQKALEAAKKAEDDGRNKVTLDFPKGEYQIYKDYAEVREYHTSNTDSIDHPEKTIGILIEDHKNLTVEGNGSLFMMHGNMMALAVAKSENITLRDFSWDFAVPTVSEMTIMDMGMDGGQAYTDFYIPKCFPFEISGNTINWYSEKSPYTGKYYWTETGIHNAYSIVGYLPDEEMTRAYYTSETPFQNVSSISKRSDTVVRITYTGNNRPSMQKEGMVLEFASSAVRETAGAFTWESTNVLAEKINVHFMHGFGWLIQMSKDVTYKECNFMPRKNSGHITVSYADIIHASGAAGKILIEDCNFSNSHDDPINLHGTFTRVENRIDDHNLELKYIHKQQGGFPQFHVGDKVAFFTRDTLQSTDNETLYTVEAVTNPGENGNDLRTMQVRFKETLPENLSDRIGNEPKYVAENVTYAPTVTIRNNTFKNVPTRGILCTTRNKVLIENNTFLNMSMATIYLSNDSDQWYESGPIRDMTIRNNTFYIKSIGRTSWEYAPAVYVHPVTKGGGLPSADTPIHKNITIEDNTFHMDVDTVVKAESVENLTIRNNKIWRTNPDVSIQIAGDKNQLAVGETGTITATSTGDTHTRPQDNVFEFTKCKNVTLEGNTYDDGLKKYAVLSGMPSSYLTNKDSDIKVTDNRNGAVTDPVRNIQYASTDPSVVTVDDSGKFSAKKQGTAEVYAYYVWNDTIIKSNTINVTVSADTAVKPTLEITTDKPVILEQPDEQKTINASTSSASAVSWSVSDFLTDGATDVVTINENGVVTAKQNGIAWIKASVEGMETKIPVVVSLPTEKVSPDFSIVRESKGNYELNNDSVTINMQGGDLYQADNTVKNLFLYTLPDSINKNAMRTIVKVDNLPVREPSGFWDTGSFLLYKDDDNYITIGKKSHYDGITSVREASGAAVETGGSASENSVSTALLGFTKTNDTVSLDFKVGNGEWQHLRDLDASMLGDNYKIGFATWGNESRGKKVTFSDFKAASSDVSYQDLENQAAIQWSNTNHAPEISNLHFSKDSYNVGENAEISYTFSDPDSDSEGASLYLWTYTQDGVEKQAVTDVPSFTAKASGTLKCEVYPKDSGGAPGHPVQKSVNVTKGAVDLTLDSLGINGKELLKDDMSKRSFDVYLPADLTKVELSWHSIMPNEGTIQISVGDNAVTTPLNNTGSVVLENLKDKDVISVKRSADAIYKINIHSIESNDTAIKSITMPEIGLNISDFTPGNWLVNTENTSSTINIAADASVGKVELQSDYYRKSIPLTKSGEQYSATVNFRNGLNTYYVIVTAKDNITTKKYIINVIYDENSDVTVHNITLNGSSLDGFAPDVYEYATELPENASKLSVAAESDGNLRLAINKDTVVGSELESTSLKNGINDVYVMGLSSDGIMRKTYHIKAIKPYKENTNVLSIALNQKDITGKFDKGKLSATIPGDQAALKIQAEDKGAAIKVTSGKEVFTGTGSLTQSLNIYKETPAVDIEITARDGKTKKSYHIDLEKAVYLSDLDWKQGATVGYGQIQKDKASSGAAIRLPDSDGNPVTFEKGIGTHAESVISYDVAGLGVNKLQGYVGIDYAKHGDTDSSVQFQIFAGDTNLFDSGEMLSTTPMKKFNVDIGNADTITLKALMGKNNWSDHADWADIKLTADFKTAPVKYYTQTITPAKHGVITSSAEGNKLLENSSVTYTFTPDEGYFVKEAVVNGQKVTLTGNQYTVDAVTKDITVSAEFAKGEEPAKYYSQTITAAKNGTITSSVEGDRLLENSSVTYTFTPEDGYFVNEATVNGQKVTLKNNQYTVSKVTENITVSAVFEKEQEPAKYYEQTILPAENGVITSSTEGNSLLEHSHVTYTFTPNEGFYVKEASVNGQPVSLESSQYTVPDVMDNITVSAVFAKKEPLVVIEDINGTGIKAEIPGELLGDAKPTLRVTLVGDSEESHKELAASLKNKEDILGTYRMDLEGLPEGVGASAVTLCFPVDSKYNGKGAVVKLLTSNHTIASYEAAVKDGQITIESPAELATFMVAVDSSKKPVPEKPVPQKPGKPKPTPQKPGQATGKPTAAKTGDTSPVAVVLFCLIIGGAMIIITVKRKRHI